MLEPLKPEEASVGKVDTWPSDGEKATPIEPMQGELEMQWDVRTPLMTIRNLASTASHLHPLPAPKVASAESPPNLDNDPESKIFSASEAVSLSVCFLAVASRSGLCLTVFSLMSG